MTPAGTRVVGYVRVSTAEQVESGAGLEAQRRAIRAAVKSRGWQLVTILADEGASGKSTKNRPSLEAAIALIEANGADALVVAKLDRLSRSTVDFGQLVERAKANGWAVVVLDMELDMTTAVGEVVANVLMSFAQFERRLIGERTRAGLAVKKAQGVTLGRPANIPAPVIAQIVRLADGGASLGAISKQLNDAKVPTSQGGAKWYPSTVRAVLARVAESKRED